MTQNPLNSTLRFLLELSAIVSYGYWDYHQGEGGMRILLAILLPVGFALLWGVFAVRGDPSRSGKTVVATPGWIRLFIELGLFAAAVWMLTDLGHILMGLILGILVLIHYIISYRRIAWLCRQK